MTITRNNLKIQKPQVLGSNADAGGQRTNNTVIGGQLNQLWKAISDVDHARGSFDLAKCFPWVDTPGTETMSDAHIFFGQEPTDEMVKMFIAESAALPDASRMTDMINILEGSVVAGAFIRSCQYGFLAGQDSFPRAYLQSSFLFDGKEFWRTEYVNQGEVLVISVEYEGNEDANYPRFEHFCQMKQSASGGQTGQVYFEPPIPYDTPDASRVINGQTGCTKLRRTSENDDIIYHGITRLTAETSSSLISVATTKGELLPKVKSVNSLTANSITDGDLGATGIIPKVATVPAVEGQKTYVFEVPDLLNDDFVNNSLALDPKITAPASVRWSRTIVGTTITFTALSTFNGTEVSNLVMEYLSAAKYEVYSNATAFPASKKVTKGSVKMTVTFTATSTSRALTETSDGNFVDSFASTRLVILDYATGVVTKTPDTRGDFTVSYSCLVEASLTSDNTTTFTLVTDAPVLDSFYLQVQNVAHDALISASSNALGVISGTGVSGNIVGNVVSLTFTQNVDLTTLSYDIEELVTLSPPPELYGLNPIRLKNAGVVNIFTPWNPIVVEHTNVQAFTSASIGQTFNVRANARYVDLTDSTGASLYTVDNTHYSHNNATGVVTINSDFAGFVGPFVLTDSIGEEALVTAVRDGKLQLAEELSQTYPVGSVVASMQVLGDLQARVGKVRDMTSWSNNWDQDGTNAVGSLNDVDYPIEVSNEGAINEEWVLIFTSSTAFRCVGKGIGQIATGDTLNDFAPVNSLTGLPYFVIRKEALGNGGGGWQTGEAVRFPTYASSKPAMLIRTTAPGHSQINDDRAVLNFRGNES